MGLGSRAAQLAAGFGRGCRSCRGMARPAGAAGSQARMHTRMHVHMCWPGCSCTYTTQRSCLPSLTSMGPTRTPYTYYLLYTCAPGIQALAGHMHACVRVTRCCSCDPWISPLSGRSAPSAALPRMCRCRLHGPRQGGGTREGGGGVSLVPWAGDAKRKLVQVRPDAVCAVNARYSCAWLSQRHRRLRS